MSLLAAVALRRRGRRAVEEPAGPGPVAVVTVSPSAATVYIGSTQQLAAAMHDADGAAIADASVAWASSDEAVATVSGTGLVTALTSGAVTVTATAGGVSGTCAVTAAAPGAVTADFELATFGAAVRLHDLSSVSDDGTHADSIIDWGDGEPLESTRCPYDTATDPPVRLMDHAYKTAGPHTVTLTAYDALGNSHTATQAVAAAVPSGAIPPIPSGRFFGGRDQYPGADPRALRYGQPNEYLDTTPPAEGVVNPALVLVALSKAEMTAKAQQLAVTGGQVLYASLDPIDAFTLPDRPYDGQGVRYSTIIWIKSDASVRPLGYPAWGERITPAIGVQLPAFRATNSSSPAIDGGSSTENGQYRYGYRITGFGITVTPTYTKVKTGGQLVSLGSLSSGITFEQCYTYLPSEDVSLIGVRRDFYVRGGRHAWIDCWIWGSRDNNTDSQGIGGWSLNGPLKIVNCFITGTEPWMTGGAAPVSSTDPELPWRPRDVEVRMCHSWRDQARVPTNIRYYDGSGPLNPGKTVNLAVPVAGWDATSRTLTLAAPVTLPDGSFELPNPALRVDYVVYVRSGTGAGQGARVESFTDATTLVLRAHHTYNQSAPCYVGIVAPLDTTSVIELRLKIHWWSKNSGEAKDCRGQLIRECVFENGSVGIDSQFFMNNFKTTVNSASDFYPFTSDVSITDCVYINTFGGITMASLPLVGSYGPHGLAARRFHFENLLMLAGDPGQNSSGDSSGNNKFRPLGVNVSEVYVRGVTAIGYTWGLLSWGYVPPGSVGNGKCQHQSIRGYVASSPNTSKSNAYWFASIPDLDQATADFTGNAIFGATSVPPGAPGTWHCEPAVITAEDLCVNPLRADIWGAADYSIKPEHAALLAATPDRLDWPRLKAATAGVRADVSIIPYQWD